MSYWILHIADPHFSRSHFDNPVPEKIGLAHAAEIKDQLQRYNLHTSFHAIVMSGDFTFAYNPAGFQAATAFVQNLAELLDKGQGSFIVIPGNHDVDLADAMVIGKLSLPVQKAEAERKFRAFLAAISDFTGAPDPFLSMSCRLANDNEPGLVILGLNSCRVERWDAQGWGYVGADQVKAICRKLLQSGVAREGDAVIAFLHHHLLPVWDLPSSELMVPPGQRKLSFTVDAASVLNAFNDIGISALIHGHTHTRSVKRVQGYGTEDDHLTMVLGAGSLGLTHHSCPQHHIQVIQVDGATIRTFDLLSPKTARNQPRDWSVTRWNANITRWWDSERARLAITAMKRNVDLAEADWEIIESWSRLRANADAARWPAEKAEICRLVRELPDGASLSDQEVERRIQLLLWNPPTWENLTGLTLQEYLATTDG